MGANKGMGIDKIKVYSLERERKRGGVREREIKTEGEREGMGAIKGRERAWRERERVKDVKMGELE